MKKLGEDQTLGEELSLSEERSLCEEASFGGKLQRMLWFLGFFFNFDLGLFRLGNHKGILGIK